MPWIEPMQCDESSARQMIHGNILPRHRCYEVGLIIMFANYNHVWYGLERDMERAINQKCDKFGAR